MQAVKQRFSQWLNTRDERAGTLWEGRFKSVLVEGAGRTLATMAAYIDLNPVRAGIVREPGRYRWSGYGEAMAGRPLARRRLRRVVLGVLVEDLPTQSAQSPLSATDHVRRSVPQRNHGDGSAREDRKETRRVLSAYRMYVFENGVERAPQPGDPRCRRARRGMSMQEVDEVIRMGGHLGFYEAMRCRVRYFTDGCVLGCRAFVEGFFGKNRERFGSRRKSGARDLRGVEIPWLFTVRDLRRAAIRRTKPVA